MEHPITPTQYLTALIACCNAVAKRFAPNAGVVLDVYLHPEKVLVDDVLSGRVSTDTILGITVRVATDRADFGQHTSVLLRGPHIEIGG